nr:hypothetical protein [Tanacetum cinerariifolium]
MMKAQVHVSKSSAISDVQPLPQRKHYCQIYQVEPKVDEEEADVQRALEESLKSIYDAPQGPLPSVTPKKNSPADQYIFQRRTSTPTRSYGHDESSLLYAKLGLTNSEVESDKDVSGIDAGLQGEGQAGPNPDDQDDGQAGPNPDEKDKGQAGPNPGDAVTSQPLQSLVVHTGPNREHMDLEVTDVSTQAHPEQMDKGFTTMAYPKPLQATATKTTTTTTIHPPPSQPQQSTTDSMLMKRIGKLEHVMENLIQDNKHLEERLDSHGARLYTLENQVIPQRVSKAVDEIVTDAVDWAIQAPLRNRFRDLPEADIKEILHQRMWETKSYKTHEDHMMLYEALEKSMNRDHSEELLKDLAEACKKKKKRRDLPKTPYGSPPHQPPPPPPPAGPSGTSGSLGAFGSSHVLSQPTLPLSTNQEGQSQGSVAPISSKTAASAEYNAWTMTDTRLGLYVSSTPKDLQIDDDMAPDAQAQSSDDEDIRNAHIPKMNLRQD